MNNCYYDERQLQIRGIVFRNSFIFMIVYTILNAFLIDFGHRWCTDVNAAFIGVMLAITFCSIQLIAKDAYISTKTGSCGLQMGIFSFCGIIGLLLFFINDFGKDKMIKDNMLSDSSRSLIIFICMLAISTVYWIKKYRDKKIENE